MRKAVTSSQATREHIQWWKMLLHSSGQGLSLFWPNYLRYLEPLRLSNDERKSRWHRPGLQGILKRYTLRSRLSRVGLVIERKLCKISCWISYVALSRTWIWNVKDYHLGLAFPSAMSYYDEARADCRIYDIFQISEMDMNRWPRWHPAGANRVLTYHVPRQWAWGEASWNYSLLRFDFFHGVVPGVGIAITINISMPEIAIARNRDSSKRTKGFGKDQR